jgi:glycosyltransferase involved in cell wall biosynthesis
MKTVILIADHNTLGSGYKSIVVGVGTELFNRGVHVKLLGANDRGEEHHYPFSIIPIQGTSSLDEIWGLLKNMKEIDYSDVLILADMPIINKIVERCGDVGTDFSGLFPLEAPPLSTSWAIRLMSLKSRFIMSKFGQEALAAKKVPSDFVPIPVNYNDWFPVTPEEKKVIRESLGLSGPVFITVAENQERKNLAATAEIIGKVKDATWVLVTRTKAERGWDIRGLLESNDIVTRTLAVEKGMPTKALRELYQASDFLLTTAKAEGLGLPILEAMACGLIAIAPKHTALEEHLSDGRGLLFDNAFTYIDPFGNQERKMVSVEDGVRACHDAIDMSEPRRRTILENCIEYLSRRSWSLVGDVICQKLEL